MPLNKSTETCTSLLLIHGTQLRVNARTDVHIVI